MDTIKTIREFTIQHITAFRYGSTRVDWFKPVLPLYARALKDATDVTWSPGHAIRVTTPEGIILTKLLAFRPQDQVDIETLLAANRDTIDLSVIRDEWAPFTATMAGRTAWLESAFGRLVPAR